MKSKDRKLELTPLDDLFSTQESREEAQLERVQKLPISQMRPFKDHPFKVKDDDAMRDTVESVKLYGVLVPALVRPYPDGGYEIVCGHRRHHACELAGKDTFPAIVRDMDDDTAAIIMVDSNLQRENILPIQSEDAGGEAVQWGYRGIYIIGGKRMEFIYKKATINDIDFLTAVRIEVLLAANQLSDDTDMCNVKQETYRYYQENLESGQHCAYLVFCDDEFVGAGAVSFFEVMPTYHNPSGKKAYIMNMYTKPTYRRKGIAYKLLDILVNESKKNEINLITLEATKSGKSLYEKYGFISMKDEMELPVSIL